jgi:hypothetical protein
MLTASRFAASAIPQTKGSVVEMEEREAAASMHGYELAWVRMHEGTRKSLSEDLGIVSTGLG